MLLGVYARDEIEDSPRIGPDRARDVTPPKTIGEKLDVLAKQAINANNAMTQALDQEFSPGPDSITHELGEMGFFAEAATPKPDSLEPVRERARGDAAKNLKRMAPTKLSKEEQEVYLQAFDAHRAAEKE